jgi:hypothetical protein
MALLEVTAWVSAGLEHPRLRSYRSIPARIRPGRIGCVAQRLFGWRGPSVASERAVVFGDQPSGFP